MSSAVVHLATANEADEITAVLHAAFVEYESLYTPEAFASTTPGAAEVQRRMEEGPVWVALLEDRVVGTLAAVVKNNGLYLRGMGILPEARATGLGRLLLETAEAFARESGVDRLYLSTTPFLERAIRLYESFGFNRTSEGPHDLFKIPLFSMEKLLTTNLRNQ